MSYTINPEACNGDGACKRVCPTNAISGESKKPHAVNPDLCIECGACGRICPKAAVVDNLGRIAAQIKRLSWPKPQIDNKICMSCNICIDACPTACLGLSGAAGKDKHGHPYIRNEKACIGCGFCSLECPVSAIIMAAPKAAAAGSWINIKIIDP
jgi:Na+-translocating ferredoxin:NAD+ oxidoreductase subunit B